MTHTPGKLRVVPGLSVFHIKGEDRYVARTGTDCLEDKANAERLAHCSNCHDELVAELKSALATIEGEYPKHQHAEYRVPEMRALIAKTEGKQ